MAEAALASIAKSALQLFTSLAKDEVLLLWNSTKELKKLEATIETISNIHHDSEARKSKDPSVQDCLSRMRDVLYDAEDLFEVLATKVLYRRTIGGNGFTKEVRTFFSKSNQLGVVLKAAHEVKAIRESLDDIRKDMELNKLISTQPPVVEQFMRPKTHSYVHKEDIIGRDEDRDGIINMLGETSNNRSPSVIAIIGFGGLGKTALAKYVYNHESVKQGFDVHLWACINDLSNLELVLIEIISSKVKRPSKLSLQKLQEKLREIINGRKFLLILDDVWDVTSRNWDALEEILRCGEIGSKVLITARSRNVFTCLNVPKSSYCVDLAVLSEESAWSLFVKKAFDSEEELREHPNLVPLGKEIVRRCGNVPLAVIIVGSLFYRKEKDERIWSDFLANELQNTLSSSDDEYHGSIKDVLMVSYNHLRPNWKLCFAYCSLFPKDHTFDKDELVRLWIAQGFIKKPSENGKSLEKEGEEYFFHLAERCFFHEVKQKSRLVDDYVGDANDRYGHTAKMHDLLHDVAIDVAKIESAFIDKVSMISKGPERGNIRHISLSCELHNSVDYCSLVSDPKIVRTLIIHPGKQFNKDPLNMLLGRFRMLRALHLGQLRIDRISKSIGELIHLRYLDLSHNCELKHLPTSICELCNLMILVLVNCELLEGLPPKIQKLVSLRQLYIHGCKSLMSLPSGLKSLTSLVKLDRLVVHRRMGGLRYLQGLDNLHGILTIELPRDGWLDSIKDARKANMLGKPRLSGMVIEWKENVGGNDMSNYDAKAVLDALEPHKNLEYLKISRYVGNMLSSWFGMLKNITELHLFYCRKLEYLVDETRGDLHFPSLKIITLEELYNLKGWGRQNVTEETKRPFLPKVSSVSITHCYDLKGRMPLFEEVEVLRLCRVNIELVTELLIRNINPNCLPPSSACTIRHYNKLKNLELVFISGLKYLPERWLRHLTHLEDLRINNCDQLEWVSCRGLAHLTALKELRIENGKITDFGDDEHSGMPWKALKGLLSLFLRSRDEHLLNGLPHLTSLKRLSITDWKDERMKSKARCVESSFKALRNLQELAIGFNGSTGCLPLEVIQCMPALEYLCIMDCTSLSLSWKSLLSMKLQTLEFSSVQEVIDVDGRYDEYPYKVGKYQSHLRILSIWEGANWVGAVPWNSLSSLHSLQLKERLGTYFPYGIEHLISLEVLEIDLCLTVKSLPIWIDKLTSLRQLRIKDCSNELEIRCKQDNGEDWHLISHLPYIEIKAKRNQFPGTKYDTVRLITSLQNRRMIRINRSMLED